VKLAQYKTTFNRIEPEVAQALIYRGWWLAGATLCAYHADLLTGVRLPVWRELPPARIRG
jgi:NTE family protein